MLILNGIQWSNHTYHWSIVLFLMLFHLINSTKNRIQQNTKNTQHKINSSSSSLNVTKSEIFFGPKRTYLLLLLPPQCFFNRTTTTTTEAPTERKYKQN